MFQLTFFIGLLGTLNYLFFILAFLLTDIFYLRLLSILGCTCAIFYYAFYADSPLWTNIFWESILTITNTTQLIILMYKRRTYRFANAEEFLLYNWKFRELSLLQFRELMRISTSVFVETGTLVTEQNKPVSQLALIHTGLASVNVDNKTVAYCRSGNLIGEISFMTGQPATATVETLQPTHYIQWQQEQLKTLLKNDPELQQKMGKIFTKEIVRKLATA